MTIDVYLDKDSQETVPPEELSINASDSIWNFHVWNDVWFSWEGTEDPLQSGEFDGWNAIDATPQEESGDLYQCGPTPLKAIKAWSVIMEMA